MKLAVNTTLVHLVLFFLLLNTFTCLGRSTSQLTLSNIEITFDNNGTHTHFNLFSNLDGSISDSWMAVGLNVASQMVSSRFS